MTLINPLLGSNFSSKFDTTLIEDSVWLDGTADYFDGPSFSAQANPTCFTFATWVFINKFSIASLGQYLWSAERSGNYASISFNAANKLVAYSNPALFTSDMVFRDVGWYHIICSFKGPDNTVEMFVNGVQINNTTSSTLASNLEPVHAAHTHRIGAYYVGATGSTLFPANSYLSQTVFLDGQSTQDSTVSVTDFLDTFEFGTNGSQFGPKSNADITALAANSFGTNSYALDFSDSSYLGHDSRPHNLITYSQDINQWTDASGTDVVINSLVAPDGSQTADQIQRSASASSVWTGRTSAIGVVETSTVYTVSAYFKQDSPGANYPLINFINPASYENRAQVLMRFSSGTLTLSHWGGTAKVGNPVFTDSGNGWWRVSFQVLTSATASDYYVTVMPNGGQTGTDPVGVWGIQVEQGALSPYVPTPKNLLRMTEDFTTVGYWGTHSNFTKTADQTIAPDGTNTADLLTKTATAGGWIGQTNSATRGGATTFTFSCFAKKSVGNYFALRTQSPYPDRMDAVFNIDTGEVHNTSVTNFTNISASITDEGNGWYRCSVTGTTPSSTGFIYNSNYVSCNSNGGFLSDTDSVSNSAVFVWGAQFEYGTAVTSYVKKTTTNAINVVPNNFVPTSITAANQSSNTPSLTYAMWNPLQPTNSTLTLSEGNLRAAGSVGSDGGAISTIPLATSGTSEFQVKANNGDGRVGIIALDNASAVSIASDNCGGGSGINFDASYQYSENGGIRQVLSSGSSDVQSGIGNWSTNDIITVRYNADDNELNFLKNNSAVGSTVATVAGLTYYAVVSRHNNYDITAYFDSADFPHTIGSGNLEINSANQPTPELQGVDNFSVSLGTEEAIAPSENMLPYSENPTLFFTTHNSGTITENYAPAPDGIKTAALLADNSTTVGALMQRNLTVPDDSSQYTWTFYVRKDNDTSRFPLFWMSFYNGTTGLTNFVTMNTKTGAINTFGNTRLTYTVVSVGEYWRVSLTTANNSTGNTGMALRIDPAKIDVITNNWTQSIASMTGSIVFAHSQLMRNAPAVLPIDDSNSTVTGNMTNGGGLSAIFDGDTTKNNSESASGVNTNANDSFVIVDHGSPKNVSAFTAFASTDAQGFDGDSGSSIITFTLAGSTDNFSSSNVTLFSDTTGDGAGKVHAINSTSTSGSERITLGAYRYHKMTVQTNTVNSGQKYGQLAQLQFFESTTPATYIPTYSSTPASLPFTDTLDLIDTTTTENYIRNNTMEGVSGGTPGIAPTNWSINTDVTSSIIGYGVTADGIDYVDIRLNGTPTYDPNIAFASTTTIPGVAGDVFTQSMYLALVGGSLTNLTSTAQLQLQYNGRDSSGNYVNFMGQSQFTPTSDLVRYEVTKTVSGASVAHVYPRLNINWDGSGAIDATFRIGNPQMEQRSHASPVIKTNQYTMNHNLALQSQTMDNATWVKSNCAVSTNVAVAPDGTTTAEGIQALNSSSSEKRLSQTLSSEPAGTFITASFYVKAARLSFAAVVVYNTANSKGVRRFVNLTNGAIGTNNDFNGPADPMFNVESVGNGWYRVSASMRLQSTGAPILRVQPAASDGNLAYAASESNVDEIYVWGAQLEKTFNSPRTYLPTTTAAVYEPTKRTSLNSFVEIQKNRDATETWAWRFSHDYDKEYAVSTTSTYQDIRDQTGTNNWVSYGLKIAEASGTAAGAVSHGFATGNTVVTHGLASSRYAVLLFPRNGGDVYVYHPDVTTGELLILNSSAADAASNRIRDVTTTTFSIESGATQGVYDYLVLDDNGSSSALGKYIGNASASGPYISTGHRPRWLWIKRIDVANSWVLQDTARHTFNPVDSYLQAESDSAETLTTGDVDFLADGFKIRTASGNAWNATGGSYVYISLGDISGNGDLPPIYGR